MSRREDIFLLLVLGPWLNGLIGFPVAAPIAGFLWDGLDPNSATHLALLWLGPGLLITLVQLTFWSVQERRERRETS